MPIDPSGENGPTKGLANGPRWRRSSKGLFVPATVDPHRPEQRIVEAAAVLPSYGGVTGWAALRWCGGDWFTGLTAGGRVERPVWLATAGCDIRPQPGIAVSAERLNPRDLVVVDGVRLTSPVRSVCFEMRYAPTDRLAVVVLDMAAYSDLVSLEELDDYAARHSGWTGIPRCRGARELSDENCWSPQEALMRSVWGQDAGRPRPLCNVPVFDADGRHIGTPDLLDPVAGVVGEYDGALHLEGRQRHRDAERESAFRAVGLECVTMLAADWADPFGFVRRLDAAYARARHAAEAGRPWTIRQPSWWIDTSTVERRRNLGERERNRLLRYRSR